MNQIREFLSEGPHAVVGVSDNRAKYGNKVLRAYLQRGMPVFAVHPSADTIEGQTVYRKLADLPQTPHGLSIITPPPVTERIVEDAAAAGIRRLWMQPGAESPRALDRARELGLDVIAGGPCVLVVLGFREDASEP